MLDEPLVTIVLPVFNRESTVGLAIDTLLSQTYQNWELVVIDDCSADKTGEIVCRYSDPRISYIRHSLNRGGGTARNTGIKAAKGEYIAFLDSDDAWLPSKLEAQMHHILNSSTPEMTVSYTQVFNSSAGIEPDALKMLDQAIIRPQRGRQKSEPLSEYFFCEAGLAQTSTLLLKRDLALSVLFREDLKKHQDWDFCFRLDAQGASFEFLSQPLVVWNAEPNLEHVGFTHDPEFSESWLRNTKKYITTKAYTAFLLHHIVPDLLQKKSRKLFTQKTFLYAFLLRLMGVKRFLRYSYQVWT